MPSEVSMTSVPLDAPLGASAAGNRTDWRALWWKLLDIRIGIIPIPVFVVLLAVFAGSVATGSLTHEINMMIAVLAVCGFICGELGKRLPVFRPSGAAAIFATFIPSALAYSAPGCQTGNRMVKRAPAPASLSTVSVPPARSTRV